MEHNGNNLCFPIRRAAKLMQQVSGIAFSLNMKIGEDMSPSHTKTERNHDMNPAAKTEAWLEWFVQV